MRRPAIAAALLASCLPVHAENPFVDAASVVPGLTVEMRYAGAHNFVGRPIAGYEASRCLLTPQAAGALAAAHAGLARRGYGLKVFDCYRPTRAVADFVAWAADPDDTRMKAALYPAIDKRDLFRLGYIAERSAHSRGSTIDLTLVRFSGGEVDMGTAFDWFGPEAAPGWHKLAPAQSTARGVLRAAMIRAGFQPYAQEWWHFTLRGEPYPTTAFDLPVR